MNFEKYHQQALDLAKDLTTEYGPKAYEAVLLIKKMNGVQHLGLGFALAGLATAFFFVSRSLYKKAQRLDWRLRDPYYIVSFSSAVSGGITSVIAAIKLLNVWNWIAVLWPDIALVHDLIDHVTK